MFDHDYNPMNDLQAIDRAHRIGQKNILNVYRLILKDSFEEKIMTIQKFKLAISHTVVNMENSSVKNIEESNIMSLFNTKEKLVKDKKKTEEKELDYDDSQYKKEY